MTVGVCAAAEPASSRTAAERVERMAEGMFRVYRIGLTSEPTGVKLFKVIPAQALDISTSFKLFVVSAEWNACTVMGQGSPPQGCREEFFGIHLSLGLAVASHRAPRAVLALSTLLDGLPWHKSCLGANVESEATQTESLLFGRRLRYRCSRWVG